MPADDHWQTVQGSGRGLNDRLLDLYWEDRKGNLLVYSLTSREPPGAEPEAGLEVTASLYPKAAADRLLIEVRRQIEQLDKKDRGRP
jgi:hypothetical protein